MNARLIETNKKAIELLRKVYKYETDDQYRTKIEETTSIELNGEFTYKQIMMHQVEGFLKGLEKNDLLWTNVADYAFTNRIHKILNHAGIITFADLAGRSRQELLNLRNMGKKSVDHIEEALHIHNLKLKR